MQIILIINFDPDSVKRNDWVNESTCLLINVTTWYGATRLLIYCHQALILAAHTPKRFEWNWNLPKIIFTSGQFIKLKFLVTSDNGSQFEIRELHHWTIALLPHSNYMLNDLRVWIHWSKWEWLISIGSIICFFAGMYTGLVTLELMISKLARMFNSKTILEFNYSSMTLSLLPPTL